MTLTASTSSYVLRKLVERKNSRIITSRKCFSLKCLSMAMSSEPPITPNEDIPPLKQKIVHDFRNISSSRIVYGAGLCSTGSFATTRLIESPTAPEQIYKPMMIKAMNAKKINRVAAGFGFSLFASSTELFGSGLNNFYQIGGPLRTEKKDYKESKQWYVGGRRIMLPEDSGKIRDLSAGRLHSLIATENSLFAMGDNAHGQCGHDPAEHPVVANSQKNKWLKINVPWDWTASKIRSVHCCLDTSFVLLESGELYAFGLGSDGQLGNGNDEIQWEPQLVEGDLKGEKISRIAGSTDTLIAVSVSGEVFIWGQNEYGQLGCYQMSPRFSTHNMFL
uniref:Uncharacterized protein n=1 Tax=Ditylenchus dipsaci TaxID=166011 RepID=A0A915CXN7_9BILA